jgi:hypothetical protein
VKKRCYAFFVVEDVMANLEGWMSVVGSDMLYRREIYRVSASREPKYRYIILVSSKILDVVLDPLQEKYLVMKP